MNNTQTNLFNIQIADDLTHNVEPILHEIRHALVNLVDKDIRHVIDLRTIPLAPGEEERLLSLLGKGEVYATLDALGPSEIIETGYTGVWLITHKNHEHDIVSRLIEITWIPEILKSPADDIRSSTDKLDHQLAQS